ncbi:DUF2325 domain-containing protein, partial [uncultured Lactobacillus sp.]|uniref:DUF2325 domain-containing protein n=1 Tax=uncultured Lactobacillus sp. TaxID=153152 RepID=UPI0025F7D712
MFDYRNNLKRILAKTTGEEQSLRNGLAAIKLILGMTDEEQAKVPTEKDQKSKEEKQLNVLLANLTELVKTPGEPKAKNSALSAIHQLLMAPKIDSNFKKNLQSLEAAIRLSKTTKDVINKKVFEKALEKKEKPKRDYRKGKRYTVVRLLSGCDLINDSNRRVFTLKESQIHSLNLKTGDIVEAVENENNPNYEADLLRVVGFHQLPSMQVDQISTFKYAVVQGRSGHLSISRNINGEKLRIRGKAILLPVDSSQFSENKVELFDGSIVDLAWYDGDVRIKKNPAEAIKIRWIYQLEQPESAVKTKKKKVKSAEEPTDLSKLDMDLHFQRVGIAIGDNQNEAMFEGIVSRYNGI